SPSLPSSTLFPYTTLFRSFGLICFFLPWVQVSCAGLKDSESGFDLARGGDRALWLVPLLMLAVILLGLLRAFRQRVSLFALLSRSEEHTSELQSRGHLVCR